MTAKVQSAYSAAVVDQKATEQAKPNRHSGYKPPRTKGGKFTPGYSGNPGGDAGRARRALNMATIREMHLAFNRGGRRAIDKVMKQSPAMFLKMLVLLVPRELDVQHSGSIKAMTDEQLETAIEALQQMIAGAGAKVINAAAEPTPQHGRDTPRKPKQLQPPSE
jgi:hypothetical protein